MSGVSTCGKGERNGLNEAGNLSPFRPPPPVPCSHALAFCTIYFFRYLWKEMRERRKRESMQQGGQLSDRMSGESQQVGLPPDSVPQTVPEQIIQITHS